MTVEITKSVELTNLAVGVVEITGVQVIPSSAKLRLWSDAVAQQAAADADLSDSQALRQQVRQMLRFGHFKASGRSKPAQEYLLRCALQDRVLPKINAPVDVLNTVSLQWGLPISLLSIAKCSTKLHIRHGRPDEAYVFNTAGQELNVTDLVVVCDQSQTPERPVGSPIKDSMAGKIESGDEYLVAILYAPLSATERLHRACTSLAENFSRHCYPCRADLKGEVATDSG